MKSWILSSSSTGRLLVLCALVVGLAGARSIAQAAPPSPLYFATTADAVTGDNTTQNFSVPGVSCSNCYLPDLNGTVDVFTQDIYERPTQSGSAASLYYPSLDIITSQVGYDSEYLYYRINMYGGDTSGGGLPYFYAYEINFDSDARGDLMVRSEDPRGKLGTTFGGSGVIAYWDQNDNHGSPRVSSSDGPGAVVDGYENLVYDQGTNRAPGRSSFGDDVRARVAPDRPASLELAIRRTFIRAINGGVDVDRASFRPYASKAGGTTTSSNMPLHDKYDRLAGGSPFPWLELTGGPSSCPNTVASENALTATERAALDSGTNTSTGRSNPCYPSGGNIVEMDTGGTGSSLALKGDLQFNVDLSVTKTDAPDPISIGQDLTYAIVVSNNNTGVGNATNVRVTDTLPANTTFVSAGASVGSCSLASSIVTCVIGTLANGASATVTLVVRPTAQGALVNTASVTGNETDPTPANNTATATTTVTSSSVGDTVFLDADRDGIQDAGEAGLPTVEVKLYTAANVLVATTTTNANGLYLFTGVGLGSYYVDVTESTVPAGLVVTSGTTDPSAVFTIASAGTYRNIDFGYRNPSDTTAIAGDLIWSDADGDGVRDPGERGIGNVTVALRGPGADGTLGTADDTTVATVTTTADGAYRFTGLAPGEYRLEVTDTNLVLTPFSLTGGANPSTPFTAEAGDVYLNGDFGYRNSALFSISDIVWYDRNGNGVRESGEAGVNEVTVSLLDATNRIVATAITDATGAFSFPSIANGAYTVRVDDALGKLLGYSGTNAIAIARQRSFTINNADNTGSHFGYNYPNAIGDTLFNDANGNGTQDPGERGLAGVTIQLWRDGSGGVFSSTSDTLVSTAVTGADGSYLFPSLIAGTYFASVQTTQASLSGYTATTTDQEPGANADGVQIEVVLTGSGSNLDADFGFGNISLADLSGALWHDLDADGRDDGAGEPALIGVTIALLNSSGTVVATTTTDSGGAYSFPDLPAASYTVDVTDNAGALGRYRLTAGFDPRPVAVSASDITGIDFGYVREPQTASIGDTIWMDADRDGVLDASERGIANVTLRLKTPGPDGLRNTADDVVVATTSTGLNGGYRFFGLLPNALYFVDVDETTLPNGGSGLQPTGDASDPTGFINLSAGEFYEQADIGYGASSGSAIGDLVWYDADGDGLLDDGEPGIGGVTLTVSGPSGIATVTTDADGSWLLTGRAPGSYTVAVNTAMLPDGFTSTPTNGNASRTLLISAGEDALFADFGFNGGVTGAIGDTVFLDTDGNGTQDAGEGGIASVTLDLVVAGADTTFGTVDDLAIASTVSDSNGQYQFFGLQAGDYRVRVTDVDGLLLGLHLSSGTNPSATTVLSPGATVNTIDFGYTAPGGALGSRVWHDLNGNGALDLDEPGIEGVTINLYRDIDDDGLIDPALDNLVRGATTDSSGEYEFTGRPAGAYLLDVTDIRGVLNGYTVTSGATGIDNNSQADPYRVVLTPATPNNNTADFGYRATTPFSISGVAFNDTNNNATFTDGIDLRTSSVVMRLYRDLDGDGAIDAGEPTLGSVLTNNKGDYSFPDLPSGSYIVSADATGTRLSDSAQTTQQSTRSVQPVVINAANVTDQDFGFFSASAPTAIDLLSFTATTTPDGIELRWETATELNTRGFHLLRSTDGQRTSAVTITPSLLPARGSSVSGAIYTWPDSDVQEGVTYTYWLQELETTGGVNEYRSSKVNFAAVAQQHKVYLPLIVR